MKRKGDASNHAYTQNLQLECSVGHIFSWVYLSQVILFAVSELCIVTEIKHAKAHSFINLCPIGIQSELSVNNNEEVESDFT